MHLRGALLCGRVNLEPNRHAPRTEITVSNPSKPASKHLKLLLPAKKRTLADKVKALRAERGLSITALAEKSGVTLSSVSAIEAGSRPNPGADTLIALAAGLRVSLDELLQFDVNSLPPEPVKPTTIEGLAVALGAINTRLAAIEDRVGTIEAHLSGDGANG